MPFHSVLLRSRVLDVVMAEESVNHSRAVLAAIDRAFGNKSPSYDAWVRELEGIFPRKAASRYTSPEALAALNRLLPIKG